VEILPLTMVNLLQRMNSRTLMEGATIVLKNTHISNDSNITDWISIRVLLLEQKVKMHLH